MRKMAEDPKKLRQLSPTEELILTLLIGNKEMFGLQMVEASEGRLHKNTIYVILDRMEKKGLVTSKPTPRETDDPGIPRRVCSATEYGIRLFETWKIANDIFSARTA